MSSSLYDLATAILADSEQPFMAKWVQGFYHTATEATRVPIPEHLLNGRAGKWFKRNPRYRDGVYAHQAKALHHLHTRRNVLLTTGTGSGKTTVFIGHGLRTLDENPKATIAGFYTAKALQTDQRDTLIDAYVQAGYKRDEIGIINGDDVDDKTRLEILKNHRVVLMTPDVLYHWVLPNIDKPEVRQYVKNLQLAFPDEIHEYNGVMGSNAFYLFRILQFVVDALNRDNPSHKHLQFIAASASLREGPAFMEHLTGRKFIEVGSKDDTSEKHNQDVMHLDVPEGQAIKLAEALIERIAAAADGKIDGTALTFIRARKAVEESAVGLNRKLGAGRVTPYIGGYTQAARDEIHRAIREGRTNFVNSTTVLKFGVDFPSVSLGICTYAPETPDELQQMIGRVGRNGPGLVLILAPKDSFRRGRNIVPVEAFVKEGVEIKLYEKHPLIVASNALYFQKIIEKLAKIGAVSEDCSIRDDQYHWGSHFAKAIRMLREGLPIFDEDADEILKEFKGDPRRAFGFRSISRGERNHSLLVAKKDEKTGKTTDPVRIGSVSHANAVRDCYPGAVFIYQSDPYVVERWDYVKGKPVIVLKSIKGEEHKYPSKTTPNKKQTAFVDLTVPGPGGKRKLPRSRSFANNHGRMTECPVSVVDRVIGYYTSSKSGKKDSENMVLYGKGNEEKVKVRPVRRRKTTGVVFTFRNGTFDADELREVSDLIRRIYCDLEGIPKSETSVSNGEVRHDKGDQEKPIENSFVIYDTSAITLRRTSRLITVMPQIIKAMGEYDGGAKYAERMKAFYEGVTDHSVGKLRQSAEQEAETVVTDNDALPLHSRVVYRAAAHEVQGRKNSGQLNGEDVLVYTVEGMEMVHGEMMYKLKPYDNPVPTSSRRKTTDNRVVRFLPRSRLEPAPGLGEGAG